MNAKRCPKKVYLVTGAAGFIGSNLCRALLKQSDTGLVVGIDSLNSYYSVAIKKRRITGLLQNKHFVFYKTSILKSDTLLSIVTNHKPDILIHTAAEVGVRNGEMHPARYFSTNVLGTIAVLNSASSTIRHAVVFSSSSVYGSIRRMPFRESEPIALSTPVSVYGASKAAMEMAVHNFHRRTGIPITIVRPFSIYGPDGRPDMLPMKLLIAAKTNTPVEIYAATATSRDWTYIDDCVNMVLSLRNLKRGLRIINIGNNNPIRLDRIIAIAQKIIRKHGHTFECIHKGANSAEIAHTRADTTRIRALHSGKLVPFEKGFTKTADYFFTHRDEYI